MKKSGIYLLLLVCLSACKSNGSQFEGKWKPFGQDYGAPNAVFTITKSGDNFVLSHDNPYTVMTTLIYDKSLDRLTGDFNGRTMDVTYDKKQDHIICSPRQAGLNDPPIELQKSQ